MVRDQTSLPRHRDLSATPPTERAPSPGRVVRLLVAVAAGLLYVRTLLPGLGNSADTARFQFVGAVWGTPHPTGYPLHTVLSHFFFAVVPWGTLAWRANLLSAVFAVGAVVLVFETLRLFGTRPGVAAAAALVFAVTPTFWSQAVVAEVYTPFMLFTAGTIYCFARWHLQREERWFYLGTFVYALSFGHHLLTVTLLPALIFLVARTEPRAFVEPRRVAWVLVVSGLGALQYGYLVWRSLDPSTVYLESSAHTLGELWQTVSGGGNRARMFTFPVGAVVTTRVPRFWQELWHGWGPLLALAVAGWWSWRRRAAVRWFLVIGALGTLTFALEYDIPDIHLYLLPVHLAVGLCVGLGLELVVARWRPALALALLLPPFLAWLRFAEVDRSGDVQVDRRVDETLQVLGADAVLCVPTRPQTRFYQARLLGDRLERRRLFVEANEAVVAAYFSAGREFRPPSEVAVVPAGLAVFSVRPPSVGEPEGPTAWLAVEGPTWKLYRWLRSGEDEQRVARRLQVRAGGEGRYDPTRHLVQLSIR